MLTKSEAIEEAARLLKYTEHNRQHVYGGILAISYDLAVAWTNLARVIGEKEEWTFTPMEKEER